MDKSSSKKVNRFITHNSHDLQTVYATINKLAALSKKIMVHLDKTITPYCQVANLVNGRLTLVVANGSVATQLRFQINDILRKFQEDPALKHINAIECKVRPVNQLSARLTPKAAKTMPLLSPQTAEIVKTIAESIDDAELREVMERIAERVKK